MPCKDVTEIISLQLDQEDRLVSYSLIKGTCSGGVGEVSLLRDIVISRSASDLMDQSVEEILREHSFKNDIEEFLHWKHLVAIQSALAAMVGKESPNRRRVCEVDEILYGPEGISLSGRIRVDILTDEIKACGRCAGCR